MNCNFINPEIITSVGSEPCSLNACAIVAVYMACCPWKEGTQEELLMFTRECSGESERLSVFSGEGRLNNWQWRVSITVYGAVWDDDEVVDRLTQELYGARVSEAHFFLAD